MAFILLPVFPGYAKVDTAQVLKDIETRAATVTSYSCDFEMTMRLVSQKVKMSGGFTFKSPDKFRMETTLSGGKMPLRQIAVCDGKTLWQYMPEMEALYKSDLASASASAGPAGRPADNRPADLRKALEDVERDTINFTGEDRIGGAAVWVFEGRPAAALREQDPGSYDRIRIFVGQKDGLARKVMVLDQNNGIVMVQEYTNIKLNPSLDDKIFSFQPPEGVKVEEQ